MPERGAAAARRQWGPALLVGLVVAVRLVAAPPVPQALTTGRGVTAAMVGSAVGVVAVLARRARAPMLAVWVTTGCAMAWIGLGYPGPGAILPVAIALYAVALARPLRATLVAGLLAGAAIIMATWWLIARGADPGEAIVSALMVALGGSLGVAARSRNDLVTAIRREAAQEAARAKADAARRGSEQRLAIARDLHDTIAHQLAVISIHAGAAQELAATNPARAATSLDAIREAARLSTQELTRALGSLRAGGEDPSAAAPLLPPRSRTDFEALVAGAQCEPSDADLDILAALPPALREVAYRVLQEAITDAVKHAPGSPIVIHTDESAAGLSITIRNALASQADSRPAGRGLEGMRERVAAIGGSMAAGPDAAGGFVVRVHLPLVATTEERA